MDINEKLKPVGHLEVIKRLADGTEELLFEDKNVICSGLGQSMAQYMTQQCSPLPPERTSCVDIPLGGQFGSDSSKSSGQDSSENFMFGGGDSPRQSQNNYGSLNTLNTKCEGSCLGVLEIKIKGAFYWEDENGDRQETYDCEDSRDRSGGIQSSLVLNASQGLQERKTCPPGDLNNDFFISCPRAIVIDATLTRRTFSSCKTHIKCEDGPGYAGHKNPKGGWEDAGDASMGTFDFTWKEVVFLGCCDSGGGGSSESFPFFKRFQDNCELDKRGNRVMTGPSDISQFSSDQNTVDMLATYGMGGSNPPQFVGCSCNGGNDVNLQSSPPASAERSRSSASTTSTRGGSY